MLHGELFPALWKHVAVGKCLMATQAHDVWLILRREMSNIIRKKNAKFLAFSPMRTKFIEKFNQAVLIAKGKGVPSLVLPTEVHRSRRQVAIPRVPDVLADVVKQVVHRECFHLICVDQDMVGEQSKFFISAKSRQRITCCWIHDIIMDFDHEWTNCVKIDDDEYFPESRYWWYIMPCIAKLTAVLWMTMLPHGFVPWAGAIWANAYVIGWVRHICWRKNNLTQQAVGKEKKKEGGRKRGKGRRRREEKKGRERTTRDRTKEKKEKAGKQQVHTFSSWMECQCRLVLSLWFMRRVNATMLVRLFQDSPSQFAQLRITTKSSSDRLPRRTGLCVLF